MFLSTSSTTNLRPNEVRYAAFPEGAMLVHAVVLWRTKDTVDGSVAVERATLCYSQKQVDAVCQWVNTAPTDYEPVVVSRNYGMLRLEYIPATFFRVMADARRLHPRLFPYNPENDPEGTLAHVAWQARGIND